MTVLDHHPDQGQDRRHGALTGRPSDVPVPMVDNRADDAVLALLPPPDVEVGSLAFVRAAARAGRLLSEPVHDALCDFADQVGDAGALLVRDLPIGRVGPTPDSPQAAADKDHVSELVLLTVARRLGQPVGYAPEHGGQIVQNLLPTADDIGRQTSTSSGVDLEFHTETAFHPHKPRYLLLLCLRGEATARTLLTSIRQVVDRIPAATRQVLREPRFRTSADESFRRLDPAGGPTDGAAAAARPWISDPVPVLGGAVDAPTFTFDADLMVGVDRQAADALEQLRRLVRDAHVAVTLEAGDLLVVDNAVAVHGRSSFPARFDGTDRWLQRAFVVPDLALSADERDGRVITTRFA
jgi:L-asparagine oxygenase